MFRRWDGWDMLADRLWGLRTRVWADVQMFCISGGGRGDETRRKAGLELRPECPAHCWASAYALTLARAWPAPQWRSVLPREH